MKIVSSNFANMETRQDKVTQGRVSSVSVEKPDEFVLSAKIKKVENKEDRMPVVFGSVQSFGRRRKTDSLHNEPKPVINKYGWLSVSVSDDDVQKFLCAQKDKVSLNAEMPAVSLKLFKSTGDPYLDYSDTKRFSIYFEDRINMLLKNKMASDVEEIISDISKEADVSEEEAAETAARLSQFSGWSRMGNLEKELKNAGISGVYETGFFDSLLLSKKGITKDSLLTMASSLFSKNDKTKISPVTLNDVIKYVSGSKLQLNFSEGTTEAIFIDDAQLQYLNDLKNTHPLKFFKIKNDIRRGTALPVIIDGWNAKAGSRDISRGMFGSAYSLKDASVLAIKEMKRTGKSIDKLMNASAEFQLKELFGEDVNYKIIKNTSNPGHDAETISKNMFSRIIYSEEIRAVIDTLVKDISVEDYSEEEAREIYAKYFDRMLVCYSSETISETMKKQHSKILDKIKEKGKTQDDLIFIIPAKNKSFDLMAYQYSKVNGISPSQFIYYDGKSKLPVDMYDNPVNFDSKTAVILDDIAGSGYSVIFEQFKLIDFIHGSGMNADLIISPLVSLKDAENNITRFIRKNDSYIPGQVIDYNKIKNSIVTGDGPGTPALKRNYAEKLLGEFGFENGASCISMPYMLPDNNSGISGLLLSFMLRNNVLAANKNFNLVNHFGDDVRQRLHDIYNK